MNRSSLSRELALRIGLAARALPDTSPKLFVSVLRACAGPVLDETKLAQLGEAQLHQALGNFGVKTDADSVRTALTLLQSPTAHTSPAPQPRLADLPGSILVAVGSDDPQRVVGHFGSCRQFLVYQVSAGEARLIDIRNVDSDAQRRHDDKNAYRAQLIADCRVLYVASIGGPAAAKIIKYGLHPIKTEQGEAINQVIHQLQNVLSQTPPPWLAKSMGIAPAPRICFEQES